jgi:hypothetical protein
MSGCVPATMSSYSLEDVMAKYPERESVGK